MYMYIFLDVMIVTTRIKNQSGLSPTQSAENSQNVDTPISQSIKYSYVLNQVAVLFKIWIS